MLPKRPHPAFAIALVMLVLGAALLAAPAPASANEADASTLTTQLQPGWNMAGWLGPEAPVSELFGAVPALERVYAWDSAHERYQRALPNITPRYGLTRLKTGMGLWLRVGGDSPVEWTRPVSEDHVLLSLPAGRHLVGWTGRDGEAFAESAGRFGEALIEASRWNAETQQYDRYRSDAEDSANTLHELNRGDAMWLDFADDMRWWQSGLAGATFEFRGELSEGQQASLQEDMAEVVTFFAERYAIEPPDFSVLYDPRLTIFAGAYPRQILVSANALEYSLREVTLAHEYFHILQRHFGGGLRSPAWMTEGTATYAGGLYERARWSKSGEVLRRARWVHSQGVTEALADLELIRLFYPGEAPVYGLAAMAVEWLEGRAVTEADEAALAPDQRGWPDSFTDAATYLLYYQLLRSAEDWEEAFEETFSIAPDDFYEAFQEYRDALDTSLASSGG